MPGESILLTMLTGLFILMIQFTQLFSWEEGGGLKFHGWKQTSS